MRVVASGVDCTERTERGDDVRWAAVSARPSIVQLAEIQQRSAGIDREVGDGSHDEDDDTEEDGIPEDDASKTTDRGKEVGQFVEHQDGEGRGHGQARYDFSAGRRTRYGRTRITERSGSILVTAPTSGIRVAPDSPGRPCEADRHGSAYIRATAPQLATAITRPKAKTKVVSGSGSQCRRAQDHGEDGLENPEDDRQKQETRLEPLEAVSLGDRGDETRRGWSTWSPEARGHASSRIPGARGTTGDACPPGSRTPGHRDAAAGARSLSISSGPCVDPSTDSPGSSPVGRTPENWSPAHGWMEATTGGENEAEGPRSPARYGRHRRAVATETQDVAVDDLSADLPIETDSSIRSISSKAYRKELATCRWSW